MSHPLPLPALVPLIGTLEQSPTPRQTAFDSLPALLASSHWLPASLLTPGRDSYRRERLYQAPDGRYSIGCFVWAPGQATPIHDHIGWGVLGVIRGQLREERFTVAPGGGVIPVESRLLARGGRLECAAEKDGIHKVACDGDEVAVSLHIYGGPFDQICRTLYKGGAA